MFSGTGNIFIDVDSIVGGADFQKLLEARLGQTRVMLSIIGDRWLDMRNPDGSRRLDDPGDFVRMEIVRAMAHGVTIIPVILEQAQIRAWQAVREADRAAAYQVYLLQRPDGRHADSARQRAAELEQDEAQRTSQRQAAFDDMRRQSEQSEAARRAAEASALAAAMTRPGSNAQASTLAQMDAVTLARELQRELKRVGCDAGDADGVWGAKATGALKSFANQTKLALFTDAPTPAALEAVMSRKLKVCPLDCGKGEKPEGDKCVKIEREPRERSAPSASAGDKQRTASSSGGSDFSAQLAGRRSACQSGNMTACQVLCNGSGGTATACKRLNGGGSASGGGGGGRNFYVRGFHR